MKSISDKTTSQRRASASAVVRAGRETIARMQANALPKKDVLVVARVAGVNASKLTPMLIPYCHPLPIDAVDISFDVADDRVVVTATVEAVAKTGVEMEALCAASAAALTIYDMLKAVDRELLIETVRLTEKTGGKSDHTPAIPAHFTAAVVVTSESAHAKSRTDTTGPAIRSRLESFGVSSEYIVLPDDIESITKTLRDLVARNIDLVLTAGGTGVGPRDVTVEATRRVVEREVPGIVEAARVYGQSRTPRAMLSRAIAGVCGQTVIVNLPGATGGAEETMSAIFPGLFHVFAMLRGEGH